LGSADHPAHFACICCSTRIFVLHLSSWTSRSSRARTLRTQNSDLIVYASAFWRSVIDSPTPMLRPRPGVCLSHAQSMQKATRYVRPTLCKGLQRRVGFTPEDKCYCILLFSREESSACLDGTWHKAHSRVRIPSRQTSPPLPAASSSLPASPRFSLSAPPTLRAIVRDSVPRLGRLRLATRAGHAALPYKQLSYRRPTDPTLHPPSSILIAQRHAEVGSPSLRSGVFGRVAIPQCDWFEMVVPLRRSRSVTIRRRRRRRVG
jgi:hypothetical protein